jgi:hypothetical protein
MRLDIRLDFVPAALLGLTSLGLASLTSVSAGAQGKGPDLPPIRQLGAVTATVTEKLGLVNNIRPLSDGRVYVNDVTGRRVLLFDDKLQTFTIIADSLGANGNTYGRIGGLVAYRGDSTLLVDPQSLSMLVLDPTGKVARVMSIPNTQDAMSFANVLGNATMDPQGRLVYRAQPRLNFQAFGPPGAAGAPPKIPEMPDSAPIFRIDLATRKIDTLAYIKTQKIKMNTSQDENGRIMMTSEINPLPVVDEWAMTSDGAVALVRGRDYHIDWVNPDGSRTASAKIPFEWQRLSDEDKAAFIDSVKAAREKMGANAPVVATPGGGTNSNAPSGPPPGGGDGTGQRVLIFGGPPGGDGGGRGRGAPGQAGPGGVNFAAPQMQFVAPSELPDYKPVFLNGFVRADADGNVWVRTIPTKAIAGGPVYDVINRKGELVERVQIPVNRTITAFGPGGVVYLTTRDGTTTKLEKATVR